MSKTSKAVSATLLAMAAFLSPVGVFGADGATMNGSVLTINVDPSSEFTYNTAIGNDVTRLVKTGAGTLIIGSDNSSFAGAVDINEGVIKITHCYALGKSTAATRMTDGAITVAANAQLYTHLPRQGQSFEQISKRLILSGNGPVGGDRYTKGALIARPNGTAAGGSYSQDGWIAHLELADDAMVHIVDSRIGIKTIDLKGHVMTVGNWWDGGYVDLSFFGATFLSGGTVYNWGTTAAYQGTYGLMFQDDATFQANETVNLVLDASTFKLCDFDTGNGFAANIRMCNTYNGNQVKINAYGITPVDYLLKGTLDIAAGTVLSTKDITDPVAFVRLDGKLIGTADLAVSGANMRFHSINPGNEYSGNMTITDAETLMASIPHPEKITVAGAGRLFLPIAEDAWSGAEFVSGAPQVNVSGANAIVAAWTGAGTNAVVSEDFAGSVFAHAGEGTLDFSGGLPNDGTTSLVNLEGVFNITGGVQRFVKSLQVKGGTMAFNGAGRVFMGGDGDDSLSTTFWRVGGTGIESDTPARMVVKGNTVMLATVPPSSQTQRGGLHVEETATQGAVLEIQDGATITNRIHVGEATNSRGAVYQYGGNVFNSAVNNNDAYCGCEHGSYGYYGLYGGNYEFRALFACGYYSDSTGIFEQRGGYFGTEYKAYVGRHGGWAEYHMTDGTLYMPNGTYIGGGSDATPQQAVMTLCGTNNPTALLEYGSVSMCRGKGDFTAVLNLNAGVFKTCSIIREADPAQCAQNNHAFVNFNGGTVVLTSSSDPYFFGSGATAIDRITIFEKGMTFDTNGKNCHQNVGTPFLSSSGRGVASIALPATFENGKYIGAPEVRISGGGGLGATAHAIFNPRTMSVTGIEVTCPGWDYTEPPIVTIATADRTSTVTCTATLTEGVSQIGGGFTKAGSGILTLHAQNLYSGYTVLRGGTLKCAVNGAIPQESTVMFEGGRLDMNGTTMVDGANAPRKWGVDCAKVVASGEPVVYPSSLVFPENSTLAVLNSDAIPDDRKSVVLLTVQSGISGTPTVIGLDSTRWTAEWRGNTFRISRRGLCLIMR
ncbi:MAG: autotransporter-associated beta strand repeat-containing protein [Kiritimatiellae bacterium]|nr:autotransporter-associated beta strand repeat-containing protein [Kiritimatiellia bacterium]